MTPRSLKGYVHILVIVLIVAAASMAGGYLLLRNAGAPAPGAASKNENKEEGNTQALEPRPEQKNESRNIPAALAPHESEAQRPALSVPSAPQPPAPQQQPRPQPVRAGLFGQQCAGSGDFKLKTFPIDPASIEFIQPMGRVQDSHVTPTNHQYIVPLGSVSGSFITDNPKKYEIKAPADGYIIAIELFKQPVEEQYRNQPYQDNYLVVFEHTCDFYTRLIHIDTLSEKVLSSFAFKDPSAAHPYASTRISVKEGEAIGTVGSHSFDFQIINTKVKNPRIINPKQLEEISAYTVDTFDYLAEPARGALLAKNLVQTAPLGGTIGYDIPGKLAGNWFKVGRNRDKGDYWNDELSVVYDHFDPTQIRVSIGNFNGSPKAHGVAGNAPDPSAVGPDSGLVKYRLVTFDYFAGGVRWDGLHFAQNLVAKNTDEVRGTALLQMLDERTLKMEVFPGAADGQATGFTSAATMYER